MNRIGLFPLGIVLFPESSYPLHIFEERYKKLINHCIYEKEMFGINFINNSKLHEVGCAAEIVDVIKRYSDGKIDILVAGINRYRVVNITEGDSPYLTAQIEYFEDFEENLNEVLFYDCIEIFNRISENVHSVKIDRIIPNTIKTKMPSFIIAQKAGLSSEQKQSLIESRSENWRLEYLIKHLNKLLPIIRETETIAQIIKNDGYFTPNKI